MEICTYPVGVVSGCNNTFFDGDSDTAGRPFEEAKNISIVHYCDPEVFQFNVLDSSVDSYKFHFEPDEAGIPFYLTNEDAIQLAALIVEGLLEDGTFWASKWGIEQLKQAHDCLLGAKFDIKYNQEKNLRFDPYWREWKIEQVRRQVTA